jgi:hypothetical protein
MSELTFNGQRAISARVVVPWRGVPYVDVDVDPELVATAAIQSALATPATVVVDALPPTTITGVIDPTASGTFVASARFRLVCGGGGWDKSVPAQDFPLPITTTLLYTATGALVLEKVVVLIPEPLARYSRSAGPASRVFADDVDWWVDPTTGVTFVGPRPPSVPDPSLEILEWDPSTKTAIVACDSLVLPGTPLIDPRIGESPVIVRDVEHVFSTSGSRAVCRCSDAAATRLMGALTAMVQELAGVTYLRLRRYRFVAGTSKLALQAVDRDPLTQLASPLPDMLAVAEWSGVPGISAILPPSLEVVVGFANGDPQRPFLVSYSTLAPAIKTTIAATAEIDIGPLCASVKIGPVPQPLAMAVPTSASFAALATVLAALGAYATAIKAVADQSNAATPVLLTAVGVAEAAIAAQAALLPTLVLEGT